MKRFVPFVLSLTLVLALAPPISAATTKKTTKKPTTSPTTRPQIQIRAEEVSPGSAGGGREWCASSDGGLGDRGRCGHRQCASHGECRSAPPGRQHAEKLLTALIVAETGNLDEEVQVVASDTWAEPTKLYIKPGETYTRREFLNILLVKSMNDVARALARDNAGSVEAFANKMNARAAQMGMHESNFVNPHGLPAAGQYSTARDMARMALIAYRNRTLRQIMCQKSITWRYHNGRTTTFSNTNAVLKNFGPCNGMKTGTTDAAGRCLISSASYGGRDVIVVVLGDNSRVWIDSQRLLSWALQS